MNFAYGCWCLNVAINSHLVVVTNGCGYSEKCHVDNSLAELRSTTFWQFEASEILRLARQPRHTKSCHSKWCPKITIPRTQILITNDVNSKMMSQTQNECHPFHKFRVSSTSHTHQWSVHHRLAINSHQPSLDDPGNSFIHHPLPASLNHSQSSSNQATSWDWYICCLLRILNQQ